MGAKVDQTNNPDVEDTFLVPTVPSSEDLKTDPKVCTRQFRIWFQLPS